VYSLPPTVIVKLVASAAAAEAESDTVAATPCEPPPEAGFCGALVLLGACAAEFAPDVAVVDAAVCAFVLDDWLIAGAAAAVPVCAPVERPAATTGLIAVAAEWTDETLPIIITVPPWLISLV
jgi:hypothetical protein